MLFIFRKKIFKQLKIIATYYQDKAKPTVYKARSLFGLTQFIE
jgi:hypothetical protein